MWKELVKTMSSNNKASKRYGSRRRSGYQVGLPIEVLEHRKGRGSSRDVTHAYMAIGVVLDRATGMPMMRPEQKVPHGMISFSEAMRQKDPDYDQFVHFYENDDQIERFWNDPWRYLDKLSRFAGVVATDYSTGPDIPDPVRRYNVYRNQLTGAWLQSLGYHALCNVRCPAYERNYFLTGVPQGSLIAVGEVGCVKNRCDRNRFEGGLIRAIDELRPTGIVVVGGDSYGVFDYASECCIPLYFFPGETERFHRDGADV